MFMDIIKGFPVFIAEQFILKMDAREPIPVLLKRFNVRIPMIKKIPYIGIKWAGVMIGVLTATTYTGLLIWALLPPTKLAILPALNLNTASNMGSTELRSCAKAFGVIEVIFWICSICAPPLLYIYVPNVEVMWIVYISIYVPVCGVRIWACIQLIKATEPGREINDAYKRCRYWRNTSICIDILIVIVKIYLIVENINGRSTRIWLIENKNFHYFYLSLRAVIYFTGGLFMRELKATIDSNSQTDVRV
ncbi:hypothetical protein HA402_003245 [Bradysia odoriphaga]|nr:hypothetical protein HA402_003245 [Bradysia odoriphaga]